MHGKSSSCGSLLGFPLSVFVYGVIALSAAVIATSAYRYFKSKNDIYRATVQTTMASSPYLRSFPGRVQKGNQPVGSTQGYSKNPMSSFVPDSITLSYPK
jgi:hypothetical protein